MKIFSRSALHEHEDPAQRVQGVAALPPDSGELTRLLAADPAPEVRSAAAQRCKELPALVDALSTESDPAVRATVAAALGNVVSDTADATAATAVLVHNACTDAVRAEVARRTSDPERRRIALSNIRDEGLLVDVAVGAELAETRQEAAGRVSTPEGLRRMAEAAKNKDRGIARIARQRIDAIEQREGKEKAADELIAQLDALAAKPGSILSAVVDIDHGWEALHLEGDEARRARWDAARAVVQARFDRERDEHRARTQFDRRLREWIDALQPPTDADGFELKRGELAALRDYREEPRGRECPVDARRGGGEACRLGTRSRCRRGRRGARRRGRETRGRHIHRQRRAARTLERARPLDAHARAHPAL
jgi:hypothetical protein